MILAAQLAWLELMIGDGLLVIKSNSKFAFRGENSSDFQSLTLAKLLDTQSPNFTRQNSNILWTRYKQEDEHTPI